MLCSLGDGPHSAVLCSSGQGVDLPVVVQVQVMVQTVHSSCSSWIRSLTCPLCPTTGALGFKEQKTVEVPQLQCSVDVCWRSSSTVVDVPVLMQRRCFACSSRTGGDMPVVVTTGHGGAVPGQGCLQARCVQTVLWSRRAENCFHSCSSRQGGRCPCCQCSEVPQVQFLWLWTSL